MLFTAPVKEPPLRPKPMFLKPFHEEKGVENKARVRIGRVRNRYNCFSFPVINRKILTHVEFMP